MNHFSKQMAILLAAIVISLALLLLLVQNASTVAFATDHFGPVHSVLPFRTEQNISLKAEGSLPFRTAKTVVSSAEEYWHTYPVYGGEMTSIAMGSVITEGTNHIETVYVGTRDAGVFKSVDGGQFWEPARTGLTFYPIRTLVTNPQDPNVLYAGTDYDGIWKSTDSGQSWFKSSRGLYQGLIVFDIKIDPQDTETLYAGLAGGVGLVIGNSYKSEDGGATWTLKDAGMPRSSETSTYTNGIFTLAINPDNPSLIYAGTNFEGAFRSTNSGETWTAINDGLPFRPNSTEYREPVNALAIDPHHDHRLSAVIGGEYYVFEAESWQQVNQGIYDANTGIGRAFLYFHPSSSTTIYSAGDRFSKSTDGGINWTKCQGWDDSGHVPEIAFHLQTPDTIYAATDILMKYWGGVYKSSDQGETWTEASQGLSAVPVQSVAIDPQNYNHIYAGSGGGHFYRSEDGGVTWSKVYLGASGISDIAVNPQDSQKIYLAGTSFYTSTNQGETFQKVDQVEYPRCIAVAADVSAIYIGASFGHGVYKSDDGGNSWGQKNEGLSTFGGSICPILSIAIDPNDADTVWAGMQYGGGIARSSDGGDSWQVMGLTETNFVEAIAVNPTNSDEILVGGGFWDGSIYKSTNGGETWQEKVSDIALVQDIVYDPRNPRWVYAATEGYGVLRSFDGGESWNDYSTGIFYPVLYSLDITQDDPPLLVVGSYSSGLYWAHPPVPSLVYLPVVVR